MGDHHILSPNTLEDELVCDELVCLRLPHLMDAAAEADLMAKSMCLARPGDPTSDAACPALHRNLTLSASLLVIPLLDFDAEGLFDVPH